MKKLQSINPFTQKVIAEFDQDSVENIQNKINDLQQGFCAWKTSNFSHREQVLLKLAKRLEENKYVYAKTMSEEMGKPITQAVAEIEKCAWVCNYYAENGAAQLKNKEIKTDATLSYVSYEPLGILLAVMPWNYPFWQFFRVLAPNIMLGNVILLKHASNVNQSALHIQELFSNLGIDEKIVDVLWVASSRMEQVIIHPLVKAVTLTGSELAGKAVATTAAKCIKKTVLELGGSNASIVLEDANLDAMMETIAWSRFMNNGQSCIAGKRFLVHEKIAEKFMGKLTAIVSDYNTGNPTNEQTKIGPMASEKLAKELEDQLEKSVQKGTKIIYGGKRSEAFFEPTIALVDHIDVPIFKEETFGPLVAIKAFTTVDEAIQLSNYNDFGLGVSIYTENMDTAKAMIPQLNEGAVFINELVKSDPRLPFGGINNSGYGRELSDEGLFEFANKKTVYIK